MSYGNTTSPRANGTRQFVASEDSGINQIRAFDQVQVAHPDWLKTGPDQLRAFQEAQDFKPDWLPLWASSPERYWYQKTWWIPMLRMIAGLAILVVAGVLRWTWQVPPDLRWLTVLIAVAGVALLIWSMFPYLTARSAFRQRKKELAEYRVNVALDDLVDKLNKRKGKPLPLPQIFELNRRQLDEYQSMTKRQQHVAFQLTWIAAMVAFVVLLVGIILTFTSTQGVSATQQYIVGGLTAVGALLSGYLGKTFFEGHRDAMDQLNYYYTEPFLTGRLLAAERIATTMGGPIHRTYARQLVRSLLGWQPPAPPSRARDGSALLPYVNGQPNVYAPSENAAPKVALRERGARTRSRVK